MYVELLCPTLGKTRIDFVAFPRSFNPFLSFPTVFPLCPHSSPSPHRLGVALNPLTIPLRTTTSTPTADPVGERRAARVRLRRSLGTGRRGGPRTSRAQHPLTLLFILCSSLLRMRLLYSVFLDFRARSAPPLYLHSSSNLPQRFLSGSSVPSAILSTLSAPPLSLFDCFRRRCAVRRNSVTDFGTTSSTTTCFPSSLSLSLSTHPHHTHTHHTTSMSPTIPKSYKAAQIEEKGGKFKVVDVRLLPPSSLGRRR